MENYSNKQLEKDMQELKFENRVQTIAVLVFFLFGIATLHDVATKLKK